MIKPVFMDGYFSWLSCQYAILQAMHQSALILTPKREYKMFIALGLLEIKAVNLMSTLNLNSDTCCPEIICGLGRWEEGGRRHTNSLSIIKMEPLLCKLTLCTHFIRTNCSPM